ncbi:MAG TPA: hypothetical protein VEK06_02835, partial [Myxococcota bacterium]|nr:hypothetical protein [Myxococcota bacterium]
FATNKWLAVLIALALLASAAYHLRLLKLLVFGKSHGAESIPELSKRRMLLYGGLIGVLLFIGLYPTPLFSLLAEKNSLERAGHHD